MARAPEPYGLDTDPAVIRDAVARVKGENSAALAFVDPAGKGGRGKKSRPGDDGITRPTDTRLRAILRAPAEVQDLYRAGLVSQKLAARLGPKNPARAPGRAAVAAALDGVPRERRAVALRLLAAGRGVREVARLLGGEGRESTVRRWRDDAARAPTAQTTQDAEITAPSGGASADVGADPQEKARMTDAEAKVEALRMRAEGAT